ncbi:MAG: hypothetical protein RMY36_030065 [Nostoc sp. SerVER01]
MKNILTVWLRSTLTVSEAEALILFRHASCSTWGNPTRKWRGCIEF